MSEKLFPYRTLPEGIETNVEAGADAQKTGKIISMYDSPPKGPFQIDIDAMLPADWRELLPPSERRSPPVRVVLSGMCIAGRRRWALPLQGNGNNTYRAQIVIDPDEYPGDLVLEVLLLRSSPASKPGPGFASDVGARLAWSKPYQIRFAAPPPPYKGGLKVEWADFTAEPGLLPSFPRSMHYLDVSGEKPRLLLNQAASNELYTLIENEAHLGLKPAVRDAIFGLLGSSVMQCVLQEIVLKLHWENRGQESADPASLPEWQQRMLDDFAAHLYPDYSEGDAQGRLLQDICEEWGVREILSTRIPLAAQVHHLVMARCDKLAERVREHE